MIPVNVRELKGASTATPGRNNSFTQRFVDFTELQHHHFFCPLYCIAFYLVHRSISPLSVTTCSNLAAAQEGRSVPLLTLKVRFQTSSGSFTGCHFLNFFFPPPESFLSDEPSFPTPSSPPPARLPDPLSAHEASSPSRLRMAPGSVADPFSSSVRSFAVEQGLLGNVLSQCDDLSGGVEPLSPWAAGEGGYCRAPGFEREDQVGNPMIDN